MPKYCYDSNIVLTLDPLFIYFNNVLSNTNVINNNNNINSRLSELHYIFTELLVDAL